MQKAQNLYIKHLYAVGEDQQDSLANSTVVLPEIMVNEVTLQEDRGWYRNKCEFREHSHNSRETPQQTKEYTKKVTTNHLYGTKTMQDSKYSDSLQN